MWNTQCKQSKKDAVPVSGTVMVLRTGACCRTVDTASSTLTSGYGDSLARLATSVVGTSPVTQWKILQSELFSFLFLFLFFFRGVIFVCLFVSPCWCGSGGPEDYNYY